MRMLIAVVVSLLLTAGVLGSDPSKGDDAKPAEGGPPIIQVDIPYYTKVEMQGVLVSAVDLRWERMCIVIPRVPKNTFLPLDVSKLEGWTTEKFRKGGGRIVRATGTLEIQPVGTRPGVTEDRLVLVVKTLEVVEEKGAPPPKKP